MATHREHQRHYSEILPAAVYGKEIRERKAKTMTAVLDDFLKQEPKDLTLLDLGSSAGIVANYLADHFGKVIGVDIDEAAVRSAGSHFRKNNLNFAVVNGMELAFPDEAFDVVVCAHIYEHVADATRLMEEIYRVLRPGGVCYFAAGNRMAINEPHYQLPFLSVIPKPLSHIYFRLSGKGRFYYETFLTHGGLRRLVRKFSIVDYTKRIVRDPKAFHLEYMLDEESFKAKMANLVVQYAYWLCPGYIWLLYKAEDSSRT